MDNYVLNGHSYCCLGPHRLTKRYKISNPHFLPYFKKHVGPDSVYNPNGFVCGCCHSKVMKLKKGEALPTPGTREYNVSSSNTSAPASSESQQIDETALNMDHDDDFGSQSLCESQANDNIRSSFDTEEESQQSATPGSNSEPMSSQFSNCTESSQISATSFTSITFDLGRIRACISTESKCLICGESQEKHSRCKIPKAVIRDIWRTHHVLVPTINRCCLKHRSHVAFHEDIKQDIMRLQTVTRMSEESLFHWLLEVTSAEDVSIPLKYDFDGGVTDDSYDLIVGMNKAHFDCLSRTIKPHLRSSENRTINNALAMFLCLLHNNHTQQVIAYNFGTSQRVVSEAIDSVSEHLEKHFVPQYLGFNHISDVSLLRHSRETVCNALEIPKDSVVLLCDGTYIYIEKPLDLQEQRATYSGQKKRNFHRYMMGVLPSGYIAIAKGPYKATDNDATVLHSLIDEEFLQFMGPHGHLVLDRGFKQVESIAIGKGLKVHTPQWLGKNAKQFTAVEANKSRLVTMCRWPVEATNGRLKQTFKFFMHTIPGGYSAKIQRFFQVACALLNMISPCAFHETEKHKVYATEAAALVNNTNKLQLKLEEKKLIRSTVSWRRASADILEDFPKVNELQEINDICRGFYNVKQALRYIEEHSRANGDFEIRVHKDHDTLVRAQIHSRFSSSTQHSCWIEFNGKEEGKKAISGHYCTCRTGARSVTSCSHTTAVIRYLMYDRHHAVTKKQVNRAILIECEQLPKHTGVQAVEMDF